MVRYWLTCYISSSQVHRYNMEHWFLFTITRGAECVWGQEGIEYSSNEIEFIQTNPKTLVLSSVIELQLRRHSNRPRFQICLYLLKQKLKFNNNSASVVYPLNSLLVVSYILGYPAFELSDPILHSPWNENPYLVHSKNIGLLDLYFRSPLWGSHNPVSAESFFIHMLFLKHFWKFNIEYLTEIH